jgi:magnesium chelatase subunit D
MEANVDGHRGDLVMRETALALAAFDGRSAVTDDDVEEAAFFALPHRKKKTNEEEPPHEHQREHEHDKDKNEDSPENNGHDGRNDARENGGEPEGAPPSGGENQTKARAAPSKPKIKIFDAGQDFKVKDFASRLGGRKKRSGGGRRTTAITEAKSGRYVYSGHGGERAHIDLALDATIRAAAAFQKTREKNGLAITIRPEDFREKIRQKKIANLLVFVVDSSGSMGADERMSETKGAVISLLKDAYIKRDKIALVVFRGEAARVALPPTGSVQRGYTLLRDLETGGRTPLNDGLWKGFRIIKNELRKTKNIIPMLIIISDGKGNVPLAPGGKAKAELFEIGRGIAKNKNISTLVIDIEKNTMMALGIAKELSVCMNARYCRVDDLKKESIINLINEGRET